MIHETAVIDRPCSIGTGTNIWHFCHLMSGCTIGKNCNLGQNVFVASGVIIGNNVKIQNNVSVYNGVTIEDDVFIGPSVVFTNVTTPRSTVDRSKKYEQTLIKKGATIGANATIICDRTIGQFAFVGAGSVVTGDVPGHSLVVGNPAKQIGWMCSCGARLDNNLICPECNKNYTGSLNL